MSTGLIIFDAPTLADVVPIRANNKAGVQEMQVECQHVPKWGYAPPPRPEGYVWAAVHCVGSNPKLIHLVEQTAVDAATARDFTALDRKPLCGGKSAFWWSDRMYVKAGKVECKRCIAAAEKRVAA